MIARGTTPTLTLTVAGLDTSLISVVWFTVKCANVTIQRETDGVTLGTHTLSITLTQAETLSLPNDEHAVCEIEARMLLTDGAAVKTDIVTDTVGRALREGVIADD